MGLSDLAKRIIRRVYPHSLLPRNGYFITSLSQIELLAALEIDNDETYQENVESALRAILALDDVLFDGKQRIVIKQSVIGLVNGLNIEGINPSKHRLTIRK